MITALLIATLLSAPPDTAKPAARDPLFGADKFKHAGMSYAITSFGYAGARTFAQQKPSRTLALTAGITAGLLKEIYDKTHKGDFSLKDLLWDGVGVAAGYVMIKQTK